MTIARRIGPWALAGASGLALACPERDFDCSDDKECKIETIQGFCEVNRYCSFPDAECPSMRRYGAQAGDGLAGTCVPVDDATTGPAVTGSATSSGAPESGTAVSTVAVDDDADDTAGTTGTGVTDSSDGAPTDGDSTTASGAESGTTGASIEGWFDDFDRPDSPALGNAWIERSPGAFRLESGRVVGDDAPETYTDSVFYRPFDEAQLDLEVSVEFVFMGDDIGSTPQIHARIQEEGLDRSGLLTAYLLYSFEVDALTLRRVVDGGFSPWFETGTIEPPMVEGQTYRLRLTVTGQDPVQLQGVLETEVRGGWAVLTEVSRDDDDPERISVPGSFGASAHLTPTFRYDNYRMIPQP